MVQVPVEDAGRAQLRHVVQLQPQRPRLQAEPLRDADQAVERRALERQRVALAKRRQVGAMAVVVGHHGQAGQAAFGRLGLEDGFHELASLMAHRPVNR